MRTIYWLIFFTGCFLDLNGQEATDSTSRQSLYDYLYSQEQRPKIAITTDAKRLLRTSSKKEYQTARMVIDMPDGSQITLRGDIKARGMMRKKVCRIPPAKFNFDKSQLDSLGFLKLDKLKFVFPCTDNKFGQEKLYKEYFLYGLYNLIDTNALQARLVEVKMDYEGEERFDFTAILVEDEDNYSNRKDAIIIEFGKLKAVALDRYAFVNMMFFQYMIANTDWAIPNRHNLEMVKLSSMAKPTAIPYDFDYAGFVGQTYAVPHESLPIKTVHDRYFFSYPMTDKEFYKGLNIYKNMQQKMMDYCDSATYMTASSIDENKAYLRSFFRLLEHPKQLRVNTKIR